MAAAVDAGAVYTNTVGAVSINTLALSAVANANVNAVAVRAGAVYAESDAACVVCVYCCVSSHI